MVGASDGRDGLTGGKIMGKHSLDARYEVPIGVVTLWQMLAFIILTPTATVALALLPVWLR